ncbi:MAG: GntR family transcriptional regulator [Ruminococcaceae bacterium]|nr:GntR family transcriptional regulator [Oscillospiraceae bacterium]
MKMINRNDPRPLYLQLADFLREQITSGQIKPGDRLDSEPEMVKKFGVARLTVREALQQLVNEGLVVKKHGKGTFCKLCTKRKNIDVLLDIKDYYFIPYYMQSISRILNQYNANLIAGDTKNDNIQIAKLLKEIALRGSDGVILQGCPQINPPREELQEAFLALQEKNIPVIMIDYAYDFVSCSSVMMDEVEAGVVAGNYFKKMGHRQVACVTLSDNILSLCRRKGLEQVFGMAPEIPMGPDFAIQLKHAIKKGITGIFCFSDQVAKECMDALSAYSIPEDVSVVSVDDTMISTFYHLTSVAHPKELIGEFAAISLMEEQLPVSKIFPPILIERTSVAITT